MWMKINMRIEINILIKNGHRGLARSFDLYYRCIDDLIVCNNKKFIEYVNEVYPSELKAG